MKYDFKKIEPKWQKKWEDARLFEAKDFSDKPKFYGLVEFPYPSGAGMHVGHIKAYSSMEVLSRKRRMQGYNVLFPIGYDAFGLPTENYAIKTNTHPRVITDANIAKFSNQLKSVGFSFDWSRTVDTSKEDYYKWTQWIFLKLFDHGLVFRDKTLVNYCPHCKVVLSNEDSQGGKCDICHTDVIQLPKDVWYLKITDYADKLLSGLDDVDYPEAIKQQEVNWIGKSTGAFVDFTIDGIDEKLEIYTTRPDTLFGVTFMVMVNPVNGKKIPIFIADYVMMGYGTGAIMAVPAHDQRDWDFAHAFGVDIIEVIKGGDISKEAYTGDGEMVNSDYLNGFDNKKDSIARMIEVLQEKGIGHAGIQFKMKDWAFNRQRYWGEPIPLVHCPNCGVVGVPYEELPLRLPEVKDFEPGEDGKSPLARIESFVNCTCPKCGGPAQRETDTMPQWAGSSWYFLRYCDPHNDKAFASEDKIKYWMPVDWYNGGMEHVTRHLIYSRFWHHFLYDIGEVNTPEPYMKRSAQGMILGSDGEKMSKSRGNVVDPLDIVNQYGADTLRVYVLFMGDYGSAAPWNDSSVKGCRRFLDRVAGLTDIISDDKKPASYETLLHKTIKKVTDDIEAQKFNTAIAALMTLLNEIYKENRISKENLTIFLKLLSPFAPHITEEIYEMIGGEGFLTVSAWPEYDEAKTIDATVEVGVQVNGKVRAAVSIPAGCDKDTAMAAAKANDRVASFLEGKKIVKEIFVPGKIINIVVK